jgi:hypothetical protein
MPGSVAALQATTPTVRAAYVVAGHVRHHLTILRERYPGMDAPSDRTPAPAVDRRMLAGAITSFWPIRNR